MTYHKYKGQHVSPERQTRVLERTNDLSQGIQRPGGLWPTLLSENGISSGPLGFYIILVGNIMIDS